MRWQPQDGCFGERKNSWLDPRIKEALEKTAKVPLWDGRQNTLWDWSQKMLRWRKDRAFRFDDKQQAQILIAAVNNEAEQTKSIRNIIERICQRMSSGATLPDASWGTLIVPRWYGVNAPLRRSRGDLENIRRIDNTTARRCNGCCSSRR